MQSKSGVKFQGMLGALISPSPRFPYIKSGKLCVLIDEGSLQFREQCKAERRRWTAFKDDYAR